MPRGRSKADATDWLRRNRLKQSPRPRGNDSRLTEAFAFSDFFGEAPERRPWITEHDDAGRSLPGFIFAFVFYWLELPTDCAIQPFVLACPCLALEFPRGSAAAHWRGGAVSLPAWRVCRTIGRDGGPSCGTRTRFASSGPVKWRRNVTGGFDVVSCAPQKVRTHRKRCALPDYLT